MSIADRFRTALAAEASPELGGPELLPTRLSRAIARMLATDGAGLSLLDAEGRRVPVGASSEMAACAERLQFTAGAGPCDAAYETGEPVFAVLDDLRRRWPTFAALLVEQTPYRAVITLPLPRSLSGSGALALFCADPAAVTRVDVFEALAVGELVTSELGEAAVWSNWSVERGPDWLHGPPAVRRAAVWRATGIVCLEQKVDFPTALALLRRSALDTGRAVDDVAAAIVTQRTSPDDLWPSEDAGPTD